MGESKTFEKSMQRVDEIVRKLEHGEAELDKSLELFEEAVSLIKSCETMLAEAEKKVVLLQDSIGGADMEKVADE